MQRIGPFFLLVAILLMTANAGVVFANTNISSTSKKVPPSFKGDSIVNLYTQLSSEIKPKSEFETRKAYEKRTLSQIIKHSKVRLFFMVNKKIINEEEKKYSPTYDAERGLLEIVLPYSDKPRGSDNSFFENWLLVSERTIFNGRYVARNAYNRTVEVQKLDYDIYGVIPVNKIMYRYQVKLSPIRAKSLKKHFGMILVGRLSGEGTNIRPISKTVVTVKPRLSYPREGKSTYYAVNILLEEVWVYNMKNREICAKIEINKALKDD